MDDTQPQGLGPVQAQNDGVCCAAGPRAGFGRVAGDDLDCQALRRVICGYITQFGFDSDELPPDLSMALGSATLTPLSMATGYAVFANGGYRVEPFIIQRIIDARGNNIFTADPVDVCRKCPDYGDLYLRDETPVAGKIPAA